MAFVDLPLRGSEAAAAAAYDSALAILRITYKSGAGVEGGTYDYFGVPPNVADELVGAESHGQFVNWEIKPHYRCERVD